MMVVKQMSDRILELEAALQKIADGVVAEADPDTGELIECSMSEDEMQAIARKALGVRS